MKSEFDPAKVERYSVYGADIADPGADKPVLVQVVLASDHDKLLEMYKELKYRNSFDRDFVKSTEGLIS